MESNTEMRKAGSAGPRNQANGTNGTEAWAPSKESDPGVIPSPAASVLDQERLTARVETLRMEVLRLRSSRRILLTLLESETARCAGLERELARLRHLRARKRVCKPRT